ncbi:hypothetical protein KEM52_001232 [Ascosphaera acerosa]|nr:hypothetical protein KEM52_001232 [Ascosphaera acerosa]
MASGNANDSNASNMASRYSKAVLNQRESRNAQEVKASRLKNPGDHRALLHDVFSGTGIVAQAGALMARKSTEGLGRTSSSTSAPTSRSYQGWR